MSRTFVVGNIAGDYDKLIDVLYSQSFSNEDILIACGDFLSLEKNKSLNTLEFFKANTNCVSVIGKTEFQVLDMLLNHPENRPLWLRTYPDEFINELFMYLSKLPLYFEVNEHLYVVNAGIDPSILSLEEQEAEVFVNIKNYDIESRFYQFENPDELSWYEINLYKDQLPVLFCFLNEDLPKFQVPAGYNLYRFVENDEPLKCLIFSEILEEPILVQSS